MALQRKRMGLAYEKLAKENERMIHNEAFKRARNNNFSPCHSLKLAIYEILRAQILGKVFSLGYDPESSATLGE